MMKSAAQLGREMFLLGTFEDYDLDTILTVLKAADDLYYNDDESFLEDNEYDALRQFAERLDPTHVYFTGVGSDVRGGKIKLPFEMGSLDQIYENEIEGWVNKWSLKDNYLVVTDKLDGTSAMILYGDNGDLQIAFSRGNGTHGADITRSIKHLASVPKNVGKKMAVRGEVIIKKENWAEVQRTVKTKAGKPYKNLRNCVAGLMNSEHIDSKLYGLIDFVAYDVMAFKGIDKVNMLRDLQNVGFNIPHFDSFVGKELSDTILTEYLNKRRSVSLYEIDGVVVDVNLSVKRSEMNPTRDTLNPTYSVKYKILDTSNYAESVVTKVEFNVSKHGYLKPTIHITPVDLVGVTISKCTGFNAKFIYDNKIQPGCKIAIVRSGEVIPYCTKVVEAGPLK